MDIPPGYHHLEWLDGRCTRSYALERSTAGRAPVPARTSGGISNASVHLDRLFGEGADVTLKSFHADPGDGRVLAVFMAPDQSARLLLDRDDSRGRFVAYTDREVRVSTEVGLDGPRRLAVGLGTFSDDEAAVLADSIRAALPTLPQGTQADAAALADTLCSRWR